MHVQIDVFMHAPDMTVWQYVYLTIAYDARP